MKVKQHAWFTYVKDLRFELEQAYDEGRVMSGLNERVEAILAMEADDPRREEEAAQLLDEVQELPLRPDYPYLEPSDLQGIRAARPQQTIDIQGYIGDETKLLDQAYGAWLGRSAGCLLGQPVEGWRRERLVGLLKATDNYPIRYYISSDVSQELIDQYKIVNEGQVYGSSQINWINNVEHMVEDDDMNYTIIGLAVLEKYGYDFTPDDVAEAWLMNLPILHVCTAERVAYKNLIQLIEPPHSASYRNMYREWIGAQIRADFFGYVNPGRPELAAEMAWRDATISHVKNGIYGEMWVAAMLAAAAVTSDMEAVITAGLEQTPAKCRLAEDVRMVLDWHRDGVDWEAAIERVHERYQESNFHHWCHTNSNAMIVTIGLLYGEHDLERSIGIAVAAAFDTDCNGATVGSILGFMHGASRLPGKWTAPLNDKIKSGVDGFGLVRISELAERTMKLAMANPYK